MKDTNTFLEKLFDTLSVLEKSGFDTDLVKSNISRILQSFLDWIYDLFIAE